MFCFAWDNPPEGAIGNLCSQLKGDARQPAPFGSFDQDTDSGSVSTVKRDSIYLFIMGLVPILIASRRLRAICGGK